MSFSETYPNSQYHYDGSGIYASSSDSDGPPTPCYPVSRFWDRGILIFARRVLPQN
ncbi:hypothetical protein EV421DRAFT_1895726 [Armillaria borealis]|uniref:Uncharacterized protein n=1 Tax=Armillaria borealis TaxID=47425 RepID=A0AA39K933_9AGAR|nr:hypothetical protein EV421DRAFT_1895726 [Armillaria borealis]